MSHPIELNHTLALSDTPLLPDPSRYRRLVGRLIYLAVTRPYISYAIHLLSQFMHAPRNDHCEAALRVIRYLKTNLEQGIFLKANTELKLVAWCDSDFASCSMTHRSLSAWVIQLGVSPISWKTWKHDFVSRP